MVEESGKPRRGELLFSIGERNAPRESEGCWLRNVYRTCASLFANFAQRVAFATSIAMFHLSRSAMKSPSVRSQEIRGDPEIPVNLESRRALAFRLATWVDSAIAMITIAIIFAPWQRS